jgi:hypothetical protein
MANQQLGFDVVGRSNASEVMGKAGKEADKLAKKLEHAFDIKGALTGAFIGAFGAAAIIDKIISGISDGLSHMNKVKEESQKAGMDPGEFDKLATVAERSGVSIEALAKSIRTLKVGMKDAMTDASKMTKYTEGLGFAEADLRSGKIKQIDIFKRVAEVVAMEENETTKLAIATAFLGDKYANELIPALQKIGDNPDIFKNLNTQSDLAYDKADRAYEKWSNLWKLISETAAVATVEFAENPFGKNPAGVSGFQGEEVRRQREEEYMKSLSPESRKIFLQMREERLRDRKEKETGIKEEAKKTDISAIIGKTEKNDNTIANSLGASMGNGPTSGVIGVGNNAQFGILEEQLTTLKQIKDGIERLAPAQAVQTDFTKQDTLTSD